MFFVNLTTCTEHVFNRGQEVKSKNKLSARWTKERERERATGCKNRAQRGADVSDSLNRWT